MFLVGLTGGMGSGKSTAAKYFSDLGAIVIDADLVAREVVVPDSPCWQAIVHVFGSDILHANRSLNRVALRERVFSDAALRQRLENILHPAIHTIMWERTEQSYAPYVILAIPLLIETGQFQEVDRVLVVDAPEMLQRQRIKTRDNIPEDEVNAILAAQLSRAERLTHAHDVITNEGSLDNLRNRVAQLNGLYLGLAQQKTLT